MDRNFKETVVLVSDLRIDVTYQSEINNNVVANIVRNFNWACFGKIMVNIRENGELYIIDGHHRFEAAKKLSIKEIPCELSEGLSPSEEAQLCNYMLNIRRKYNVMEILKTSLAAGDEKVKTINRILEENNIKFAFFTNGNKQTRRQGRLSCFSAVLRIMENKGEKFFNEVIVTLKTLWRDDSLGWHEKALGQVAIKGLAFFLNYAKESKNFDSARLIKKCRGHDKLEKYIIMTKQNRVYNTGTVEKHFALSMLSDYNSSAQKKLDLKQYS